MQWIALSTVFAGYMIFAARRLLRYLHIFQQEEYDAKRFLAWLWRATAFDKRLSALIALVAVAALFVSGPLWLAVSSGLLAMAFLGFAFYEPDPRQAAKKKLVLTSRAKRILGVALLLCAGAGIAAALSGLTFAWLIAVQVIPLVLVIANYALWPVEARIQNRFKKEAMARLSDVAPTTIAITGSFGKTSVKHMLGHVLRLGSKALFTPGSVNTVMGVSRIIRERLADDCRFFVVEMGAYGPGSIRKLCEFTPPQHGIITSIGAAHYERFKSLETVAMAKFELAEAVIAAGGKVVVDDQVLEQPYASDFVSRHRDRFVTVGTDLESDVKVESITQSAEGLHVTVRAGAEPVELFAPLFGEHHGRNMALAFAMARELGIDPGVIVPALRSVPQIAHRLEVRREAGGVTYIDDAFNSNPTGFENALDVMGRLQSAGGRKILVTPGMVELGAKHDAVHADLGAKAASMVDIALVVKSERIPTFVHAFDGNAHGSKLVQLESFDDADKWLRENSRPKDIVLLENDLPDLYERPFPV